MVEVSCVTRKVWQATEFAEDSHVHGCSVQIGAIFYRPEHGRTAVLPPAFPHQDRLDGAVIALNERGTVGGVKRIFSIDEPPRPLYELELAPGQGFLFRDAQVKHYVSDVQLALGASSGHRDIVIIRFTRMGH